ncbi:Semenogelin-1 [Saguinus oedipus]|uniref:Semenogelin-1 n=1 Tax=Saguinus oedipus TaxID=9490 RepID=A0ABQ9VL01_SAGOE|nr:Semenogelin-1 [Saguinus oedipus]
MKPIIFLVLSLLLILEKQAAVMGQKGGSKGRLPSESSQFPHGQKGQQYCARKDKQHAESKRSVSIEHTYHVDIPDHDQTRTSKQYDLNAQNKRIKSEKHAAGSQEPFNHKQEGREHGKSKGDFHVLIIHHKRGHAPHGTQNPSQDQGNSTSGKGISSQDSNTKERLLALGLGKEQDSVSGTQRNGTQGGSQSSPVLQTEDPVHNKKPETQNSLQNKGSSPNVNETKQKHSSKVQSPLCSAQEDRLQHGSKDVFSKNQNQTRNPNQDQEHGQKAHNRSCQCSSTEERRPNHGEKGIQKDASKGSTSNQTEDKMHDKSQKQVTTPSQEDGHRANKTSSQSSGTEERRPNHGEKGIQKDASKGSTSNQTEDKMHDKSQKQVTTPSQEDGHRANKTSSQSSGTEERRPNHGEKGIQKDASKGSTSNQTEDKMHDKSQKQVTTPSQEDGHRANKTSSQSSGTEERRPNHGEKGIRKDASKGSTSNKTEDKMHDKSQKQVTTPSQEDGHRANKTSSQSSGTEERRPNHGEKGIQKDASKGSSSNKTEDEKHDKSQKQVTTPSQDQQSGQDADEEEDLLSHYQKDRHQHRSYGGLDIVIVEHEADDDDRLTHHDNNQNSIFT